MSGLLNRMKLLSISKWSTKVKSLSLCYTQCKLSNEVKDKKAPYVIFKNKLNILARSKAIHCHRVLAQSIALLRTLGLSSLRIETLKTATLILKTT